MNQLLSGVLARLGSITGDGMLLLVWGKHECRLGSLTTKRPGNRETLMQVAAAV